jgi:hypothetical protein
VLDLAKAVGEFESLRDAAECVAIDFDVPRTLQGSHLKNPDGLPVPPACDDPLALLVRSGVWATLSIHAQRLIPVFLGLGIWDDGDWDCIVTVANRALMRYGHIASFTNISVGVAELERVGWLMRMEPRGRGAMPIKGAMPYHLTPLSERVRELADATAPAFGDAIRKEKSERKRKRQEREQHLLLQQKRFRQRGRRP